MITMKLRNRRNPSTTNKLRASRITRKVKKARLPMIHNRYVLSRIIKILRNPKLQAATIFTNAQDYEGIKEFKNSMDSHGFSCVKDFQKTKEFQSSRRSQLFLSLQIERNLTIKEIEEIKTSTEFRHVLLKRFVFLFYAFTCIPLCFFMNANFFSFIYLFVFHVS